MLRNGKYAQVFVIAWRQSQMQFGTQLNNFNVTSFVQTLSNPNKWLLILAVVFYGSASVADTLTVPSGQPVTFQESIWGARGPSGLTIRFRFVTPEIGRETGSVDFETAEADMAFLCESYAVPRLSNTGPQVNQIIISFADRELEFGYAAPEATQFFEAYQRDGASCIWEGF